MFATALTQELWFLLEYNGIWQARATADNTLPEMVQEWLDAQVEATAGAGRVQFIKQPERPSSGVNFFIAAPCEEAPRLYHFQLERHEQLLELDVSALITGDGSYEAQRREEPLYLVCTNGRRDRCCARYGIATYNALVRAAGANVWQTTHVGGHRFAANVISFPDGVYYGRLTPEESREFVAARRRNEIYLPGLRGRSCYDDVVQAADYFLRQESGALGLAAFRHVTTESEDENRWLVTFEGLVDRSSHTLELARETSDLTVYASCGKPQAKTVWRYELVGYDIRDVRGAGDQNKGER